MSWNVEEKLRKWKEERDNIAAGFDSVKASYLNVATANPNDTTQLNFWDDQLMHMRERLSNLHMERIISIQSKSRTKLYQLSE